MDIKQEFMPYAKKFIQSKTARLSARGNLNGYDVEDIRQELFLDLYTKLEKFDEKKAKLTTFIQQVVNNKFSNLLRKSRSSNRLGDRNCFSFDNTVAFDCENQVKINLGDCISSEQFERFRSGVSLSHQQLVDQKIDVDQSIQKLPPHLQRACRLLLEGKSVADAAQEMGIGRSNFYKKVIWPLREQFREDRLENF